MNKKVEIGSWITLAHFSIAEIMTDAGFDWLCVDLEHSVVDYYQAEQLIAAISPIQKIHLRLILKAPLGFIKIAWKNLCSNL